MSEAEGRGHAPKGRASMPSRRLKRTLRNDASDHKVPDIGRDRLVHRNKTL